MKQFTKKYFGFLTLLRYSWTIIKHPRLLRSFFEFRKQVIGGGTKPLFSDFSPCVHDKTTNTNFDTHYIYHPAWATRAVKKINPGKHIDISSTLHFSTHLSAFITTEFYDFRPANLNLSDLSSASADLCNLHFPDDSIDSLSCMHTVEHIGLGRYGDPIDPGGDMKAMKELQRVLKKNGNLLFVVPVGKPKIQFNAHRVYSYEQIINQFDQLHLVEFSLIPDNAGETGILLNADPRLVKDQNYGCGCFWFKKG